MRTNRIVLKELIVMAFFMIFFSASMTAIAFDLTPKKNSGKTCFLTTSQVRTGCPAPRVTAPMWGGQDRIRGLIKKVLFTGGLYQPVSAIANRRVQRMLL